MKYPPEDHATLRTKAPKSAVRELSGIPGVGPAIAADLYLLGIEKISDLKGNNPTRLYERLMELTGVPVDRCVLYTFRCAVYFATEETPEPEKLKWWNWKEPRNGK